MKKNVLLLVFALAFSPLLAENFSEISNTDCCRPHKNSKFIIDESLKDVIAPNTHILNCDSLRSGKPIVAYKTSLDIGVNEYMHTSSYFNGVITTCIAKENSSSGNHFIGEQSVKFTSETGRVCECVSKNWTTELVGKEKYIVHSYHGFKVYTNHESQFVIGY